MIKQKIITSDSEEIKQILFVQKIIVKALDKHATNRDVAINAIMQLLSSMFANEAQTKEELKDILLRCTKIMSNEALQLFEMIGELKCR